MITKGTNYDLSTGLSYSDDLSGLSQQGTYTSSPDWNYTKVGTYTITYELQDNAGNIGTATRTIKVTYVGNDGSGAAAPEILGGNLIPVKWNGTAWVKADPYTPKDWYDYNAKKWANAVTVTASTRASYQNAAVNTVVKEADILTYLVWIPRYKYKLFNVSSTSMSPRTIEVVFEDATVAKSNGSTNGTYLTHPAFTYANIELNGMWVGKFETTGSISSPCVGETCTTASLTIKPNLSSVRNQRIHSIYSASISMNRTGNMYGFGRYNYPHVTKNTEWGAVAYLTYSKYGKNSEVWINNNTNYVTGCVGSSVNASGYAGCQNTYSSTVGANGSTTGNIYGIYDMNGGSQESVMGTMYYEYYGPGNSNNALLAPEKADMKIFNRDCDLYADGTNKNDYSRRILGDATGEVRGWNSDTALFIYKNSDPMDSDGAGFWFLRGGMSTNAASAGIFHFSTSECGESNNSTSFRVTVSISPLYLE